MEKIALLIDSTCGLPKELIEKYKIHSANLKILYTNEEYIDGITITPEEVYSRLNKEIPTTSMPAVQDICDIYERLISEGYTHAIAMPISSGLSGTINSFRLASQQYEDKITSFVFDTKILSMALGLIVLEVVNLIQSGKSFEDICEIIPKLREKTHMYFTVDTLEYLIKGGRIGKVKGNLGQMLKLKPIITIGDDGKYATFTNARGTKQSLTKLKSIITDILDKGKSRVVVMTGTMIDEAKELYTEFKNHSNVTFAYNGLITPVVGVHSGPKIIAIGVMEEL